MRGVALATRPSAILNSQLRNAQFVQQRRLLSDDSRKKIDAAVKANPVVVFMKGTPSTPQCGFSRAVAQILDVQGVPKDKLKTYNVLEDQELREGIKEYSSWPTIPQVYLGGEFVGGCDIMLQMHQSGELAQLLADKDVLPSGKTAPAPESQFANAKS